MEDSAHENFRHVLEPNETLKNSPDSFFYIFESLSNRDYLSPFEYLITNDGTIDPLLQNHMALPEFRRKWVTKLRNVTNSLHGLTLPYSDFNKTFASMTKA